jgi:Zn-dependent M28 family amino/carboxypeptidase
MRPRYAVPFSTRLGAIALALLTLPLAPGGAWAAARFDGARALHHVSRLVALGPRPAGSPAGARAREYIAADARKLGLEVRVQPFTADTPHGRLALANVVAVLPGRRPDVILVGGHYDTKWFRDVRFVGANDGGSSAALLLELARVLAAGGKREYTYWIAFFDGEEARETWTAADSLYGSRHMVAELKRTGALPRAMILVDMIGDRDLALRREAFSTQALTDLVWASARRLGYARHFLEEVMPVEDDHAPFLRAGVPSVLLIDFDYPPWHTGEDTLDKVSAQSLQIVGDVVLEALPRIEDWLGRTPGGTKP